MNKDLLRAFGKASAMNAFPSSQKIAEISSTLSGFSNHMYGGASVTIPVRKGETVRIAVKGELGVYAGFIPAKAST